MRNIGGGGAELSGDQVTGLDRYVEAPNDGHWVQDTESNCAEVAWMQIPDKASDVSLGHWGQVAKSSGAKVPGAGSPDEALDVSLEHWGAAVLSPDETPEVSLEHCVQVAGADTTDEAPDDEHWGANMAAVANIPDVQRFPGQAVLTRALMSNPVV